jgi:predicted nuclease with TOPRIM domain
MLGFRRKNSEVKESVQELDLNEEKNSRLEEALELTLSEVRELRAEMTLLRKELTSGKKDMEQVGERFSKSRVEEISAEENTLEPPIIVGHAVEETVREEPAAADVIEGIAAAGPAKIKLLAAAETAATSDSVILQSREARVDEESPESDGAGELEQPAAGWATIKYRPVNRRCWWQFWMRKKEKPGQGNLDFA